MGADSAGAEQKWERARLIPTAGIRGQEEQETRATSALLAVLPAVPDFGHALLKEVGAPKGHIATFTEVRLKGPDGKTHIPDGAIVVTRGKTRWSCLVEVKTGRALQQGEQVARYLDMAREHGFDALLTISNEIRSNPDDLPYDVDRRKLGRLTVRHISWWRVLTEAVVQHRFRGIEDPDQGPSDPGAGVIAARWEQFVEYLALQLSQELGVTVQQVRSRGKSPRDRLADSVRRLADDGVLEGALRVPGAVGDVVLEANLRSGRVTTGVEVAAPADRKRPKAKVSWVLRQLKDAPDDLRIDVSFERRRGTNSELLSTCRDNPDCLLVGEGAKLDPRKFFLALSRPIAGNEGAPRARS